MKRKPARKLRQRNPSTTRKGGGKAVPDVLEDAAPRDATGRFAPLDEAARALRDAREDRDDSRLIKYGEVREALAALGRRGLALAERLRAMVLFGNNPIVRMKLAKTAGNVALGKGPSVQHRVSSPSDFGGAVRALRGAIEAPKKQRDSGKLQR